MTDDDVEESDWMIWSRSVYLLTRSPGGRVSVEVKDIPGRWKVCGERVKRDDSYDDEGLSNWCIIRHNYSSSI